MESRGAASWSPKAELELVHTSQMHYTAHSALNDTSQAVTHSWSFPCRMDGRPAAGCSPKAGTAYVHSHAKALTHLSRRNTCRMDSRQAASWSPKAGTAYVYSYVKALTRLSKRNTCRMDSRRAASWSPKAGTAYVHSYV